MVGAGAEVGSGVVVAGWAGAVVIGCMAGAAVVVEDALVVDDVDVDADEVDVEDDVPVEDWAASAVTRLGVAFFQSSMLVESVSIDITESPDARAISMAWLFG